MLLTKLDLGKNKIARVEGLETLSQLTQVLHSDESELNFRKCTVMNHNYYFVTNHY